MSFRVIHCHHFQSQNCLARCSYDYLTSHYHCHYLSLSLPLPLDEPVVIDAKEDKELAPSDMSARLS